MPVKVESFLRIDSAFVKLEDCTQQVVDDRYVEGAIVLRVNNTELIGLELFDLVDQLWIYIINELPPFLKSGYLATYFPDQPIRLILRSNSIRTKISITVEAVTIREASAPYTEFVTAILAEAQTFFERMIILNPRRTLIYLSVLEDIKVLRRNAPFENM